MKQPIANLLIRSPQLLLVDDDPEQLNQMIEWLGTRPSRLFQARTGEQALHIVNKNSVDGIVTDWQMPGISGIELIKQVRATGFKGPILICTGLMLSPENLQQAFAAGASDYLRKPLHEIEFLTRLENSLNLYAQRETLSLYNSSQSQFVQYLTETLGENLQQLRQSQQLDPPQTVQQGFQHQVTEQLTQQFNKLMLWARYRFSLNHVHFSHFELRQMFKSLELHFVGDQQRLFLRGGKQVFLHSDLDIVQRILFQLLDNALRYTQGEVIVQVTELPQSVRIAVQDRGAALSEGELERLVLNQQTGMGLRICHDLLELLGSRLQGQLRRGGGVRFFFELSR